VAWAEVYFRTKWRLHPSSRLATIDMGQKLGGVGVPFFLVVAGSPSNTKSPGLRPNSMPSTIQLHLSNRLATINMGQEFGGSAPPSGEGDGVPI